MKHERANEGATNVWLTPPSLLAQLGEFDLDPCAAPEPRPWSTAARHFVEADDGLSQLWRGRVWCNPPYGPHMGIWMDRLADHGNGVGLIHARTDTAAFQRIVARADAVLFLAGRIIFHGPDGRPATKMQFQRKNGSLGPGGNAGAPSCLIAYGEQNVEALKKSVIAGFFVRPLPRKVAPIQRALTPHA